MAHIRVWLKPGDDVEIGADKYGTPTEEPGYGTPVFVEYYQGKLRVHVWADINEQDPVSIDMEKAREKNRKPEA